MSMPAMLGIVPFTGMSRSRKYWSMVGNVYAFVIKDPAVRTPERFLRCARVAFPCLDLTVLLIPTLFAASARCLVL